VAAAKMWLGGNLIALQRSPGHLQFMDLASSNTFVQAPILSSLPPLLGTLVWQHESKELHQDMTGSIRCSSTYT